MSRLGARCDRTPHFGGLNGRLGPLGANFRRWPVDGAASFAWECVVSLDFLVGAILGSGIAIVFGRAPAQRLVDTLKIQLGKARRKP